MSSNVKKRIFYYDELRAFAIILVIICHALILYKPYSNYVVVGKFLPMIYIVTHIAVPIFFMLSGALLLNRKIEFKSFFKKRFTRILLPFIFWVLIAIVTLYFFNGSNFSGLFKIIVGKQRWTWFVWVMIGVYLFIPVVNSFIKDYGMKGCKYFLVLWLVTVLLETFHHYPFYRFDISAFAGYMGYLVLGYYITHNDFKLNSKQMMLRGALLCIVCLAIDCYLQVMEVPGIETKYLSIFIVLASAGFFLFAKAYDQYCQVHNTSIWAKIHSGIENGILGKAVLSLSTCSFGMYLLNSILYRFVPDFALSTIKFFPLVFIVVFILSWVIVSVLSRIPVLSKFSGAG